MKKLVIGIIIFISGAVTSLLVFRNYVFENKIPDFPSEAVKIIKSKPLEKYTIENLSKTKIAPGTITLVEDTFADDKFTSYLFSFKFSPSLDGKTLKQTTGQLNIPKGGGVFPLVLMFRGYIDQELYKTGDGTNRAAQVFAENEYITIAPDFLGYADSDDEAGNIFESRFQTYTTALMLIKSLDQIDKWNKKDIFIWGHSNGGQIALTILEILSEDYPATLWAPVSKPFPYSILYYTVESEDRGKLIRKELAKFEDLYDVEDYSLINYLGNIDSPLQIHQGTLDDAVPLSWNNEIVSLLEDLEKQVSYFTYTGTGHNMRPVWNSVVSKDVAFFEENLKD